MLCDCGAEDCEACRPGCTTPTECSACGSTVPRWQLAEFDDTPFKSFALCEHCKEEGFGRCDECGEVAVLVDNVHCPECWADITDERIAEKITELLPC